MSSSRREFLQRTGMLAVAGAFFPHTLIATPGRVTAPRMPASGARGMADPHALAAAAVEAARKAGASYADARLTHRRLRRVVPADANEGEELGIGIRALVNGYWGFASSSFWSLDEAARLGREAVAQARANALGGARAVEIGAIPAAVGEWTSPLRIDPFSIATSELRDWLRGLEDYAAGLDRAARRLGAQLSLAFERNVRTFASSEGAACSQTVTTSRLSNQVIYRGRAWPVGQVYAQGGWELVKDVPLTELFKRTKAEIDEDAALPIKPVEPGRYRVLLDQLAMGTLVGQIFGDATELDRALGYEANAGGTSYLNDPLAMLGSYQAGAPLLTVSADRSRPGSLATTKWDDEGVAPEPFNLVHEGKLVDYQTSRESAAWLAEWYSKRGVPVRSHGCAATPSALQAVLQHTPNLALRPATAEASFDDLLAGMSDGLALRGINLDMDWQRASGLAVSARARTYEVKRGKRTAVITGAGMLFRSPDLWRSLVALGGPKSQEWLGIGTSQKGEPAQTTPYTIGAVPGVLRDLTIIDVTRKA